MLDFEPLRRRLRVRRSVSDVNGRLVYSTTKTYEERDVPVPRFLADLLLEEVAGRKLEELIFTSPRRKPLRPGNWRRRVWDPAVQASGLAFLTPHDLRHTAASLAIASGASVKHVQRMLGHKDAAMTLNVYASLFEDDLDAVSDRLDDAIHKAGAAPLRPTASGDVFRLSRTDA